MTRDPTGRLTQRVIETESQRYRPLAWLSDGFGMTAGAEGSAATGGEEQTEAHVTVMALRPSSE
jgi:hypothetical protein